MSVRLVESPAGAGATDTASLRVSEALAAVRVAVGEFEEAMFAAQVAAAGGATGPASGVGCDARAVAGLLAVDRVIAALEARRSALIVQAVGEQPETLSARRPNDPERDARVSDVRAVELAAHLRCTPNRARTLAYAARILVCEVPRILAAVDEGIIDGYRARIAADAWRELMRRFDARGVEPDETTALRFQNRVLARAAQQTASEFRRSVNAAVALLTPRDAVTAPQDPRAEGWVAVSPAGDGMAYLTAYLGIVEATRVMQVLEHAARHDQQLTGPQSQRAADALVAIIDGVSEITPQARAQAAEIQVLVPLAAITGECAAVGQIAGTDLLVEGQALLDLMSDARFRRLIVTGPDWQLLDYGRQTYRPPAALADQVRGRDRTCRAPGCVRPARYADLDHVVPWNDGGSTSPPNLAALCRTHHVLKTHGGWQYTLAADGATRWTLPSGAVIDRPPGGYSELSDT